jgi:hypothetical protein
MTKLNILFAAAFAVCLTLSTACNGQTDAATKPSQTFSAGLRFQKAGGFYWSNGITAEYSNEKILKQKISLGFNLISSKLGTALNSNAIPFYEADLAVIKYFRQSKSFKPQLRLNFGYAHANYGSETFNSIPNHSFLLSFEAGAVYDFKFPIRIGLTGGYNFITGNGENGLGVIYPVYAQASIIYRLLPKSKWEF